ncbi:DUF6265 family protein [Lacimicrobium alkaliphilum]|uniref:DUF6265 domain-containing protein n=1 Tax=Lacimicrobium alkaliphilum TaxID=1526571 RepID=A0A0U3AAW0_9ALTE|nr:DUF6265 family protein [Lacimicrobium alkaliphilum]ALS98158.1 hypothetical protein AT746_07730 [Lacimicrobium alkaliphilum]
MKTTFFLPGLLILTLSVSSKAQTLEDLNWMSGYWVSSEGGATLEELWMPASGGMMVGLNRSVYANGRSAFEYLRIAESDSSIVYLASPGGSVPVPFILKEVTDSKAVFENLEHDFPQRIIYSVSGDQLTARIEDESGAKGQQWIWRKANFKP